MPFSKPCVEDADDPSPAESPTPPPSQSRPAGQAGQCAAWHSLVTMATVAGLVFLLGDNGTTLWDPRLLLLMAVAAGSHFWIIRRSLFNAEPRFVLAEQLEPLLDQIPDGLLITDQNDRVVIANRTFLQSVGLCKEDLVGRRASSLPWIRGAARATRDLPWVQANRQAKSNAHQLMRYRLPDGKERFFSINASPVTASPIEADDVDRGGAMMTVRDVTQMENDRAELEQMLVQLRSSRDAISSKNRELRVLADADPLTGCLNRRAFFDEFRVAWKDTLKSGQPLSCVMLDVDHFKKVNDEFGHQWGDEILRAVSTVLRKHFASPMLVGRYGGEEFCAMMPGLEMSESQAIAEVVRLQIAALRFWERPELRISASLGLATYGPGVKQVEDLVRQADECLYMAKHNGRNQVVTREDYRRIALAKAEHLT